METYSTIGTLRVIVVDLLAPSYGARFLFIFYTPLRSGLDVAIFTKTFSPIQSITDWGAKLQDYDMTRFRWARVVMYVLRFGARKCSLMGNYYPAQKNTGYL